MYDDFLDAYTYAHREVYTLTPGVPKLTLDSIKEAYKTLMMGTEEKRKWRIGDVFNEAGSSLKWLVLREVDEDGDMFCVCVNNEEHNYWTDENDMNFNFNIFDRKSEGEKLSSGTRTSIEQDLERIKN